MRILFTRIPIETISIGNLKLSIGKRWLNFLKISRINIKIFQDVSPCGIVENFRKISRIDIKIFRNIIYFYTGSGETISTLASGSCRRDASVSIIDHLLSNLWRMAVSTPGPGEREPTLFPLHFTRVAGSQNTTVEE